MIRLYQIVTDHFHDQDILFDGKNLTDTVEGPGMILKASSVQMGDIVQMCIRDSPYRGQLQGRSLAGRDV